MKRAQTECSKTGADKNIYHHITSLTQLVEITKALKISLENLLDSNSHEDQDEYGKTLLRRPLAVWTTATSSGLQCQKAEPSCKQ